MDLNPKFSELSPFICPLEFIELTSFFSTFLSFCIPACKLFDLWMYTLFDIVLPIICSSFSGFYFSNFWALDIWINFLLVTIDGIAFK